MSDLIERQEAEQRIDEVLSQIFKDPERIGKDILEEVSSVPLEVVRCKDCEWFDCEEGAIFGYCDAAEHKYHSPKWAISIRRRHHMDFYCADAERREDG